MFAVGTETTITNIRGGLIGCLENKDPYDPPVNDSELYAQEAHASLKETQNNRLKNYNKFSRKVLNLKNESRYLIIRF